MKKTAHSLHDLSIRASMLDGITQLLSWDQETYMPEKAAAFRAKQIELVSQLSHAIRTGPEYEKALKALKKRPSATDAAYLRLYVRDFEKQKKLPARFVQEFVRYTSESILVWQKAKITNNFALFRPRLEKIVDLVRKKTDYLGYDEDPYDCLINECEAGMRTSEVASLFAGLAQSIKAILQKHTQIKRKEFQIPSTQKEQLEACHKLLQHIGFNFNAARIDLSTHPFCSCNHPTDCRITARRQSNNLVVQLLTTLHEAGHSFYAMGLPEKYYGTPLGQAISCGIHESQSRFWETRIGRSKGFWKPLYPWLQKEFHTSLGRMTLDDFVKAINTVGPSLIRTDADEVTYQLHIILRFDLERELISGKLKVKDLPERWKEAMKELVGITPKNDQEGCLQDIHWAIGAFGYFPTYTLGNVYAAQMFEAFAKAHPTWEKMISQGKFDFIKAWLHDQIWRHGRRYDGKDLIRKISGKDLSNAPFIDYLKSKYNSHYTF